jgi:ketosteroid isomerase-like protein
MTAHFSADMAALQVLLDKQALSDLVHTYCRAVDRRDFKLVRTLYHDDAIDHHGHMFIGTADQFVAWLPTAMAQFEATVHAVSNLLFKVDGDKAEGEIYTTAYHRTPGDKAQEIVIGGRYLDRYERRGDAWKFIHRALACDWVEVKPVDKEAYKTFAAGAPAGTTDSNDPSYALEMFKRL